MLAVTNVSKVFGSGDTQVRAVVDDVSFSIPDGQFAAIVGRSGSGKSTLLSLLGGLDRPSSGTVDVDGTVVTSGSDHELIKYRRQKVGFVFQSYQLIPNLSAVDNVMLPMEFAGMSKASRRARARELLDRVRLTDDKQTRRPNKLSGGEQQRVAIARSLANQPKVILADEPTGNLDSKTGLVIIDLLADLAQTEQATVIIVTHDQAVARRTDVVFEMEDGQLVAV